MSDSAQNLDISLKTPKNWTEFSLGLMLRLIPLLLLTAIALCFYGGVVKLAARILRFNVTWKSSFVFALLMLILVVLTRGISPAADQILPVVICQMFVMAMVFAALGSWFFRSRVTGAAGQILGWSGSIRLSVLALSLILVSVLLF
jgi:lipopolysaccharide export LptBFGC system permease protein LptF